MIKVGFIDYFLDEWHANNYPSMFQEASNGEVTVAYCWAMIDSPKGGLTSKEWAEKYGVTLCDTMEEVIEKSDVLCVLSPDNPEMHEILCEKPLKSGKTTYIDKTFAPDLATAKRIFAVAEANNTPAITTSALRYASEYQDVDTDSLTSAISVGGGLPEIYMIHQIEPIVLLFGAEPKRLMNVGSEALPEYIVEFADGRRATIACCRPNCPFQMVFNFKDTCKIVPIESPFFMNFIHNLITFYKTSVESIPHAQTYAVIAIREAAIKARAMPDQWLTIEM